jgi:LDH2 family malate/lactate/ureidoglycolate dehydrogenase
MVQVQKVVPDTKITIKNNGLVTTIEGNKGLGYLAAEKAVQEVIKLGKANGIGFVTVYNCYPTGCMGQYTETIAHENLIGFVITHSPPRVAPHGSTEAIFSTGGHSFGFPSNNIPYIYDSSVGAITNGQIMVLNKLGKNLPPKSVLSKRGTFTENPNDVIDEKGLFNGVIASAGGIHTHKISGFAGSLELLAQLALVGKTKTGSYSFFMSINPSLFGSPEEYQSLVSELQSQINNSKPTKMGEKVYFAGQQSYIKRQQNREKDSVSISEETFKLLFPER